MSKQEWQNLWTLLKDIAGREKSIMLAIAVFAITKGMSPFISMLGMGTLVDFLYNGAVYETLLQCILWIAAGGCICSIVNARASEYFEQKQEYTKDLEALELNRKSLYMDYEYLEDTHVQDLRSRAFAKSYYGIRGWYLIVFRNILTCSISVLFTMLVLVPRIVKTVRSSGSMRFVCEIIVLFGLIALINWIVIRLKLYYAGKVNDGYNASDNLFTRKRYYMDMLAGMESQKDLRIYGQREKIQEDITKICKELQKEEGKRGNYYIKRNLSTVLNTTASGMLIYLFVVRSVYMDAITIGDVIVFSSSVVNLCVVISNLAGWIGNLKNVALYAQDYLEFMNLEKRKYPGTIPVEKRRDNRFSVSFENVSFRYPGTEVDVIKDLTIAFEIGEKMAIVGKNGSGKSTFIKLLCRLYDVTEGCIKVNGIDIRKYDYKDYCALFGAVFQDFSVFAFSFGENIAASDKPEQEQVEEALYKVGLGERLEQLEDGLETFVGADFSEKGVAFSGGEKQKMAIARAIYKDAPFVIMDEPTAALDPQAECEVYAGFDKMVGKKTALYISHRLASCRFCEDILVFDKGSVVQRGSHEQLKEQEGIYKELWNAQAQYYA